WCEPERKRDERQRDGDLRHGERVRGHQRAPRAPLPDLADASVRTADRQPLERVHGLSQRAPPRQTPQREREQQLAPPDLAACFPQVATRRALSERCPREREQNRLIEPRLRPPDDEAGKPRRGLVREDGEDHYR